MRVAVAILVGACAWLVPHVVRADVARYALVVGHDRGHHDEQTLRFAQRDARRFADVLTELGGFADDHVTVLRGAGPDAVQGALIAINDRIRTKGEPAVLVVFYSGHADAQALHLGTADLSLERLEQLVRGSAAQLRLLIVDACRSGSLTRAKGGDPVPAPPLRMAERLPADGLVVWTSSAENEDAQESDELEGSFFTHYLVSGLLGAADANNDGVVTLTEAYTHAYDATLRATSKTLAGVQHATFRDDIRGLGDLTLTRLVGPGRGQLAFVPGHDYLVMQRGPDGAVVAEIGARDVERHVSVRAGRYYVRARTQDYLLEGNVDVQADRRSVVDENRLSRVEYARLVRKGASSIVVRRSDHVEAGYTIRSSLYANAGVCQGAMAGWGMDLPTFTLDVRGVVCRAGADNAYLSMTADQLGGEVRLVHAWDVGQVTLSVGPLAGVALLSQRFSQHADARTTLAAMAGVTAGVAQELTPRLYLGAELDGVTAMFRQQEMTDTSIHAAFAVRGQVIVGTRW